MSTVKTPRRKWTIPGDVLNRIALDVSGGISTDDSVLLYNEEMLDFRKIISDEFEAFKVDNPGASLHVPEDLPGANIPAGDSDE